jgi:uncharacterized lipoprotein YmbA
MSRTRPLLAVAAALLLAAGCRILPAPQADAAHFYQIGVKYFANPEAAAAPRSGGLRLGLARVELPAYLQNRAMVIRHGETNVTYQQNHRWAEPLDEAVARIVRAKLLAWPSVATVSPAPFPIEQTRDYDVTVRVLRCEGAMDGAGDSRSALFAASIEIARAGADGAVVARKNFTLPTAWDGKDFSALAGLLGQAVAALGDAVAAALPAQQ